GAGIGGWETRERKTLAEWPGRRGGDKFLPVRYPRGAWSEPMAVTERGGDLYKPAVAVDDSGRAWVFWSANNGGNFDLYARSFEAGKGGKTLKLPSDRGPGIAPGAATDAKSRARGAVQRFRHRRSP